jgi:uncharacterized protein YegL
METNTMNDLKLRLEELNDNSNARLPICLALDTSGSMVGSKLDELNAAVRWFFQEVRADEMAAMTAEIATVSFGGSVRQLTRISGIERQQAPVLTATGSTPMGEAVNFCLDLLEQAKREYMELGVDYFQPWLVLMTDGAPTDDISKAVARCQDLLGRHKLTVIPIAIGSDADLAKLALFSENSFAPVRLNSARLKDFFAWLSKSIQRTSMSNPGDSDTNQLAESLRREAVSWEEAMRKGSR